MSGRFGWRDPSAAAPGDASDEEEDQGMASLGAVLQNTGLIGGGGPSNEGAEGTQGGSGFHTPAAGPSAGPDPVQHMQNQINQLFGELRDSRNETRTTQQLLRQLLSNQQNAPAAQAQAAPPNIPQAQAPVAPPHVYPAAAAPQINVQVTPESLFAKPSKFKGERGPDAERFLVEMHQYIQRHNNNSNNTIVAINDMVYMAISYMEDKASQFKAKYMKNLRDGQTPFASWAAFEDAFKLSFARIDDSAAALEELKKLRQGLLSAAEYHDKFHQSASRTPLSDDDKRIRFYDGLNDAVKDAIVYSQANVDTYDSLCREAIRLDNRIAQRKWEGAGKKKPYPNQTNGRFNPNYYNTANPNYNTPAREPDAMDIDAGKVVETRSCYNCGKQGHLRRYCREPPKTKGQFVKATGTAEAAQANQTGSSATVTEASPETSQTIAATFAQIMDRLAKMEANMQQRMENQKGF